MKKLLVLIVTALVIMLSAPVYAQTIEERTHIDKKDLERISYALENVKEDTNYTRILWMANIPMDESDIGIETLRNDFDYEFEGVKYWVYENVRVGIKTEGDIVKVIVRKR